MDYLIKQASPEDFLEIAALDRLAWPEEPDTFIPDGEHAWRLWSEYATILIAESSDENQQSRLAGALLMFPTNTNETILHKIMVHPDFRGQGIGSALMKQALQSATEVVLLTVNPDNTPAVRLYESFGFQIRTRIEGYYRPHEHRLLMEFWPAQ
ncbi:MAG: GNAT family N-acetyltransferase [Planctomycetes bacterium]|nr:GNAT family N-acetyltransferase [Planctomycetota bacterium]MCH9724110.1 GNAT family N-acetyltransferase [Planctomycetota bacterium]MCH9778166.1 GNAT family N-acetyltransferase [Planctomycetota bacterium]MCH9792452.1 GNAT family N-acetyltransferase [Planctomycetota bacterium]